MLTYGASVAFNHACDIPIFERVGSSPASKSWKFQNDPEDVGATEKQIDR